MRFKFLNKYIIRTCNDEINASINCSYYFSLVSDLISLNITRRNIAICSWVYRSPRNQVFNKWPSLGEMSINFRDQMYTIARDIKLNTFTNALPAMIKCLFVYNSNNWIHEPWTRYASFARLWNNIDPTLLIRVSFYILFLFYLFIYFLYINLCKVIQSSILRAK